MASNGEKFLYFVIGGFVGAAVGLLLAPKSGEETRAFLGSKYRDGTAALGEKARQGRETIAEKSREVTAKVSQTIDKGREMITRQREQMNAAIEAGKQAYEDEKAQAGSRQVLEPILSGTFYDPLLLTGEARARYPARMCSSVWPASLFWFKASQCGGRSKQSEKPRTA